MKELIEKWRNEAEALRHHVGEQNYVSALRHCATELEDALAVLPRIHWPGCGHTPDATYRPGKCELPICAGDRSFPHGN